MTISTLLRTFTLGTTLALSPLALAQGAPPAPPAGGAGHGGHMSKVREACRPDVERLCKVRAPAWDGFAVRFPVSPGRR